MIQNFRQLAYMYALKRWLSLPLHMSRTCTRMKLVGKIYYNNIQYRSMSRLRSRALMTMAFIVMRYITKLVGEVDSRGIQHNNNEDRG